MTSRIKDEAPHILVLSYSYILDDPRVLPLGKSLFKAGYQITVIGLALRDNLPTHQSMDGIHIVFAPLVMSFKLLQIIVSLWRLLKGDLREVEKAAAGKRNTNKLASLFFNLWIVRLGLKMTPSAIHCHTYTPLPAAWFLAKWLNIPYVYDSVESVPDYLSGLRQSQVIHFILRVEEILMRKSDVVVSVGERLAQALTKRGAQNVVIIGNWKRRQDYALSNENIAALRAQLNLSQQTLVISFFGNLSSTTYQLIPLLKAVEQSPNVTLLISGIGDMRTKIKAIADAVPNIFWLDWIKADDLPLYTLASDVVYCCLKGDFSQAYFVAPNKLFEAFAAGKPVIAQRGVGELSTILEQTEAGILVDEVTSDSLKVAFQRLQNPEVRALLQFKSKAAGEQYNWSIAEERLKALYDQLLDRRQV